ncbi:MAG: hypothetical protein FJ149_05855 [Euryarchaeota archaeon]|nr:hypothetical protein [Euryarchaeota archaeon]
MGVKEWYMDRMLDRMSPEERKGMMNSMMDKFFERLTPEEKKELLNSMMPRMMDKMLEGTTAEDRLGMMMTMMPTMMSRMFGGGEGGAGAPFDMPALFGGTGRESDGSGARGDFRPWECCPCRHLCEQGRKDRALPPTVEGGSDGSH